MISFREARAFRFAIALLVFASIFTFSFAFVSALTFVRIGLPSSSIVLALLASTTMSRLGSGITFDAFELDHDCMSFFPCACFTGRRPASSIWTRSPVPSNLFAKVRAELLDVG